MVRHKRAHQKTPSGAAQKLSLGLKCVILWFRHAKGAGRQSEEEKSASATKGANEETCVINTRTAVTVFTPQQRLHLPNINNPLLIRLTARAHVSHLVPTSTFALTDRQRCILFMELQYQLTPSHISVLVCSRKLNMEAKLVSILSRVKTGHH